VTDGTTAAARLARLLHVIPAASRDGGASLSEMAEALGTTPDRIYDDLAQVTARAFYHPGGWPDDIQIYLEADRVRVAHPGGLDRPVQLSALETLCLSMGLRSTSAAARVRDAGARATLLGRAEAHLASAPAPGQEGGRVFAASDVESDEAEIREEVLAAARDRRTCAIVYARAGGADASARVIHPYTLVYAQGAWYAVGWCAVSEGVRVFRTDRILEACRTDHAFDLPEDFRAEDYLDGGRVYHAPGEERVRVRYSPRIARWVRERAHFEGWTLEEEPDGSVVMEHPVADPHWVVSHALQYGAEAEVLGPAPFRELVREVVEGMGG
jgi:proteasome accessory factor C